MLIAGLGPEAVDGIFKARSRQALCAWRDLTGRPSHLGPPTDAEIAVLAGSQVAIGSSFQTRKGTGVLRRDLNSKALRIEVNRTCQVAFAFVGKKLVRAMAVSTGRDNGYHNTRLGRKRVYSKSIGWQSSYIFPEPDGRPGLFYPVYFDRGIAFHGVRNPVGVTPASHGCVRTRTEDQLWLFPRLRFGTLVVVYGDYFSMDNQESIRRG